MKWSKIEPIKKIINDVAANLRGILDYIATINNRAGPLIRNAIKRLLPTTKKEHSN